MISIIETRSSSGVPNGKSTKRNAAPPKEGRGRGGNLFEAWTCLWRAVGFLRRRERGEDVLVRVAVRPVDGARVLLAREPGQERLVLRVIGEAVHGDGIRVVRQAFDDVAVLQVVLAEPVRREPPGDDVVQVVARDEGIAVRLRDLVAQAYSCLPLGRAF